jgi:hypothetical protein
MELAAHYSGARNPGLLQDAGNYWVMRSRTFALHSESQAAALEQAGKIFRKAVSLVKGKRQAELLKEIRLFIVDYYPDEETILKMGLQNQLLF